MQFSQEKNYYWIRQKKLGLYAYDPQRDRMSVVKNDRELSFFFEKPSDREGIYMVRDHSVILIRYKEDRLFESIVCTIPIKQGERIRALHDDRRGNLWIGTTYHLFRYSLEEGRLTTVCDDVGFINAIVSSNEGVVYFATESRGLWRISGESRLQIKDTGENYSVLTVAPDNNLWVGTKQGNVYSYSPDTNDFISRTKDCGLTGDAVLDIKSDDDGNLWILTSQRVMVYHPGTHIFTMMSCTDSWINLEDFQSLYKGPRGEMSVGGRGGIVTFPHYNEKKRRIPEPTVCLTSVEMNNTSEIGVDNQKKISLSPHERNVKLFFSTFDHLNTNKVRYAYRYKQRNDNWVAFPAGENSIGLSDLSKGEFELEVRATDENGLWSKSTLTVMIQCLPAWYETGWAYLFYVLVVLSVVWGLDRMYLKLRESMVAQTVLPLEQNPEQRHEIDPLSEEGKVEANSISASDEQLIRKALDMVEKNLSNPEYSIEDLSRDMCMSRATLYRKITSITGSSPSDFVKNVRLRKAAELLKEGGLSIAEIADQVGLLDGYLVVAHVAVAQGLVLVVSPYDVATRRAVAQQCLENESRVSSVEGLYEALDRDVMGWLGHGLFSLLREFFDHARAHEGGEAHAPQGRLLLRRVAQGVGDAQGHGDLFAVHQEASDLGPGEREALLQKCANESELSGLKTTYRMYKYSKWYRELQAENSDELPITVLLAEKANKAHHK